MDAYADGAPGRVQAVGAPRWLAWGGAALFAASATALAAIETIFAVQPWSMLDLRIYRWTGLVVRRSGDLYSLHFPGYHLGFTYSPMAALIFAATSVVALPVLKWLVTTASMASLVATLWITWGGLGYPRGAGRTGLTLA